MDKNVGLCLYMPQVGFDPLKQSAVKVLKLSLQATTAGPLDYLLNPFFFES